VYGPRAAVPLWISARARASRTDREAFWAGATRARADAPPGKMGGRGAGGASQAVRRQRPSATAGGAGDGRASPKLSRTQAST
jgi:hypothetical protein